MPKSSPSAYADGDFLYLAFNHLLFVLQHNKTFGYENFKGRL